MTSNPISAAQRNKANYLRAKEAFNRNDIPACIDFYHPDHQIKSKPSARGRKEIEAFLVTSHESWPGIQIVAEHVVAEGDLVMGRCVTSALHSMPVFGIQPTMKRVETTFWDLHRFDEQGLIVETWNLTDALGMMGQLGLTPGAR